MTSFEQNAPISPETNTDANLQRLSWHAPKLAVLDSSVTESGTTGDREASAPVTATNLGGFVSPSNE